MFFCNTDVGRLYEKASDRSSERGDGDILNNEFCQDGAKLPTFCFHAPFSACPTSPSQSGFAYDRDARVVVASSSVLSLRASD